MAQNKQRRHTSVYFPAEMAEEISKEAARQERSTAWLIQQAWKLARETIRKMEPSTAGEQTGDTSRG